MKVADLQALLRSFAPFLMNAGGSKTVATDLERMAQGLTPFQERSIADFADFLAKAEEYARTGTVPGKAARVSKPKAPAKSSEEIVRETVQLVFALYEKALDPDFRYEMVDEQLAFLKTRNMTAAILTEVAKEFEIPAVPKTKDKIIAEIARKIRDRREFHDRSHMNPASQSMPATQPVS